ncbi:DUF1648 domain-containing protein [Candidatus Bathyarchaeota archaeon]|nr:DUF1648 domain-containing protein [Candidatus Bathyarchaeota archaeon]
MSSGIMRRAVWASVALVLVQFLVAFYLYPRMPERVAIHWGLSGEADGYGSRFLGLFLVPIVSGLLLPLMVALPRLDPSGGIERFRGGYDWFVFGFLVYMGYVQGLTLAWNLGWRFSFMRMLAPAMGGLFVGIGVVLRGARLNWFMGIRTPWTLSSEEVWDRTHEVGSRLFMVSGGLAVLGALAEGWLALALILVPVMFTGIYLVYYSYSEYHRLAVKDVG